MEHQPRCCSGGGWVMGEGGERRKLQCSPPTNFTAPSGNGPQFSALSFSDYPRPAPPPPLRSFWPTPCCLLQAREWAELCAVQTLLHNTVAREPVDQATSRQLSPFAEPTPFILNLLQIREESGNPEKALLGPEPPSR